MPAARCIKRWNETKKGGLPRRRASASSITSAATLTGGGKIPVDTGANGISLSSITSVVATILLILPMTCDKAVRRQGVLSLGLVALTGLLGVAVTLAVWAEIAIGWLTGTH